MNWRVFFSVLLGVPAFVAGLAGLAGFCGWLVGRYGNNGVWLVIGILLVIIAAFMGLVTAP